MQKIEVKSTATLWFWAVFNSIIMIAEYVREAYLYAMISAIAITAAVTTALVYPCLVKQFNEYIEEYNAEADRT
jgi:hypothetical protein